ncbi:MAG: SAF domain-containing protein [Actinobacteria bacterium]|nr:SAF domain-containing protein [Chloroflexota bacterium]MBE3128671.1 SAF domain-containing protein [Actinomycetota bacterium]
MKKYYRKYLILAIMGSIIIGVAFYLLLNNYLDRKEIIVASRDINIGEKIGEDDLYFKEYYKNSLPENYLASKEDVIGNIINIERKKDDYISKDMFDKDIQISIFDNLLPGDVMITVNIQYLEPILKELKKGNYISIVSTVEDKDLISSKYFESLNINSAKYLNQDNYYKDGDEISDINKYFSTGTDYIDNNTFDLSENIILINGQIVVRNLEIIYIEENVENNNKNILLSSSNNTTVVYLKCSIKEAPIVARLTKDGNYKIIVEDI